MSGRLETLESSRVKDSLPIHMNCPMALLRVMAARRLVTWNEPRKSTTTRALPKMRRARTILSKLYSVETRVTYSENGRIQIDHCNANVLQYACADT